MKDRKPVIVAAALFVISGLMLTVIQAPIDWSLFAWVALVPFAMACSPQMRVRRFVALSLAVGFVYWLANLYWITPITLIGWTVMAFYLAWFWPLVAVAVRFCRARGIPLFLALPVIVVGAERLQGFPMGGFYWRFLGHSQYESLAVIQIADLFGAAGVSLVVAMVSGAIADSALLLMKARRERLPEPHASRFTLHASPIPLVGLALTAAVVAGTLLYGQWRLQQATQLVEEGPLVAALQSNVPQSVKRSFSVSGKLFDELMVKSRAAAGAGAELIVWPETMVQGLLDPQLWPILVGDLDEDKAFHQQLCEHANETAHVLVGAYGAEVMRDGRGERYLGHYNSAYLYRPDGTRAPGRYDKIHLVLFGEYIPFKNAFPWLFEQLKRLLPEGFDPNYSLEHGRNYTIFEMAPPDSNDLQSSPRSAPPVRRFAVIICYEDTVPYVARNFALDEQGRKRIDWLVNISNDGWFVRFPQDPPRVIPSAELPQHAAICVFRAVENRLPILRSVNTGISCLIESTGRIRDGYLAAEDGFPSETMDRTGLAGWFLDRMPIDKRVTFYSRHGQWLDTGCAVALAVVVAWPLGASLVRRRS